VTGRFQVGRRTEVDASLEEVLAYHLHEGCFERLAPPWQKMRLLERTGGIEPGARTVFYGWKGPIRFKWVAEHIEHDGVGFTDVQRQGPFGSWIHQHDFESLGDTRSALSDTVAASLPVGKVVPPFITKQVRTEIETLLRYRHLVTKDDLQDPLPRGKMRIAVTGASGLIGSRLCARLRIRGHEVVELVRSKPSAGQVRWNPNGDWDPSPLEGIDAVIHLAGESIGGGIPRWTENKKRRILESREEGTRSLATGLAKLTNPPRILVSTAAVGYYGHRGDEVLNEDAGSGDDFLAEVVRRWEAAAQPARDVGIKVVHPRIGLVLAAKSGAMTPLLLLGRLGLFGPLGSGEQFWPWISLHDVTRGLEHLAASDLEGPVNLTGPGPVPQREFAKTLGRALGRPSFMPAPRFAVELLLGELGKVLLLSGQRAVPDRLMESGFSHAHSSLEDAMRDEFGL
jgi:uncharacterized protein